MAHPLHLNLGLVVILRIRLQHMLNDDRIDGDNRLLDATKIEPEGIAVKSYVLRENLYRIVGHRARIEEGAKSGDGGHALRQGHASRSARVSTTAGNPAWSA